MKDKENEEIEEEVKQETPNTEEDVETAETEVAEETEEETIEQQLEKANEKIAEMDDKYLRLMAEFDNYRRRVIKEKAELILNGGEKVLKDLLPVIDDLERAQQDIATSTDMEGVKTGVDLIIKKFVDYLKAQGVEEIETKDQVFDDNLHEAIAMIPSPAEELKGKIIDCTKKGYTMNGKVIRHAQVAVGG